MLYQKEIEEKGSLNPNTELYEENPTEVIFDNRTSKISNSTNISKEEFKILVTEGMCTDEMLLCKKLEKSPLYSYDTVTVIVEKAIQVPGSLFSSGYTSYSIKCEELGSRVSRRYKDFEWLQQTCKSMFPTTIVS